MSIQNVKRGAPIFGVFVLAVLLALPLVLQDQYPDLFPTCAEPQFDFILTGRVGQYVLTEYQSVDLQSPIMGTQWAETMLPWCRIQTADADTLGGNNTVLAAPVYKVSDTKMSSFNYSRTRFSALYGDTSGVKLAVPGMSSGDVVLGVLYMGEDGVINTKSRDMTDSTWYHKDTIQIGGYTDSGTVIVLFHDRTE